MFPALGSLMRDIDDSPGMQVLFKKPSSLYGVICARKSWWGYKNNWLIVEVNSAQSSGDPCLFVLFRSDGNYFPTQKEAHSKEQIGTMQEAFTRDPSH